VGATSYFLDDDDFVNKVDSESSQRIDASQSQQQMPMHLRLRQDRFNALAMSRTLTFDNWLVVVSPCMYMVSPAYQHPGCYMFPEADLQIWGLAAY
jgi:hypothetical protein